LQATSNAHTFAAIYLEMLQNTGTFYFGFSFYFFYRGENNRNDLAMPD